MVFTNQALDTQIFQSKNEKTLSGILPTKEQNSSGVLTIPIDPREDSIPTIFVGSLGRTVTRTHELLTRKEKVEGAIFLSMTAPGNRVEACLKSDIIV